MRFLILCFVSLAVLTLPAEGQVDPFADFVPVTDEMLRNPDPADWLSWRATLNHWGFSPLDQINTDNVGELKVVWSRAMAEGGLEATPLVYDGIMYLPHPGDIVQALDATTGDLVWEYRRELPEEGLGNLATRNLGIWEDKIILLTKDNFIIALDATSGELVWETLIREPESWGGVTSGPIIADGKAISGRSCDAQNGTGGPDSCFITAHDLETGEELWRFYTIPREGEPGFETWGNVPYEDRRHVGSWITPSFDPELNLVYFGTSVTSPYAKFYFADPEDIDGEFLYQTSTLAIEADSGELVWYQQHIRDQWDADHPFERILVDTAIAPNPDEVPWINPNLTPGEVRQVLTGIPGKTGIFYSIDRATGEFLWARETTYQNLVSDIDPLTGRATHPEEAIFNELGQQVVACRGKNWPTGAYSPLTHTIYYPLQNSCVTSIARETDMALGRSVFPPDEQNAGTVRGISVETGEELWRWENRAAVTSLVATGGGLLFGGDLNRRFRAFDQETGRVLWEHIMPAQVGGFPISYAVDGRQYIAVPVGSMLIAGPYLSLTPELQPGLGGNAVVVFAIPED